MFIQNGNANDDGIEGKGEREGEKISRRRNNSPNSYYKYVYTIRLIQVCLSYSFFFFCIPE